MRAIFEENCETGQEVKYDIFKPFLSLCMCVCMHMCALPSAGKKQLLPVHGRSLGYFKCVAAETASLWLLKNKEKNLQLMCFPALHDSPQWKKPFASFLFAPSRPRHHLSSCQSTAAYMALLAPLCSLIQVHSPEVIWNIVYSPLSV